MNPDILIIGFEKEKKPMDTGDFTIEKGIPAPREKNNVAPTIKSLEVGDSFLVPKREVERVTSSAYSTSRRYGMKLVSKANKDGSVRFWRIK